MRARVLTALALIPPVLAAVFITSPWPILVLLVLVVAIGAQEISKMTRNRLVPWGLGILVCLATSVFYFLEFSLSALGLAGAVAASLAVSAAAITPFEKEENSPLGILFGGWVLGPAACLYALHQAPGVNVSLYFSSPLLMAVLPLWAGDTAAIFAGKAFGRHLLAPSISPKKTIEGAVANLLACVVTAWMLGSFIKVPALPAVICGVTAGVLGQVGDLFESAIKRRTGLKDSGAILPGHGGIMDRIDSILFTAPIVAIILLYWR